MPDPRAFISFDYDHNINEKNLFVGQSKNSKTPFNIQDWSAKSDMPQNKWEKIVEEKIKKCNILIVLSGRYVASATGVNKEIAMAKKNNIPVFGVFVDGANSKSNLPNGLQRNRTISWEWDAIAKAIKQVMKEGKNSI